MKNGIPYPLAPEVIKIIEEKRKEFNKNIGVRISQARFSRIIAPTLRTTIKNIKLKPRINKRRRRLRIKIK